MIKTFKYVPISEITERYGQGWIIASILGPPHGFYSVLMEYIGDDYER